MRHSHSPDLDKMHMIEWLIFNLAVGNMDSHAKNISLLFFDKETKLAPFYDMVCTLAYPNLSQKFAFKIGGENRPGWLRQRHWERFANEVGMQTDHVNQVKLEICNQIETALPQIVSNLRKNHLSPESDTMLESISAEVRRGIGRLRAHTQELDVLKENNTYAAQKDRM